MKKEPIEKNPLDKSVLSFFLIAFPTVVIILVGIIGGRFYWLIQIVLAIYQLVTLKQFIDSYYDVMEART